MADYILINGELYHHGVKGMKWGVRKKSQYKSDKKTRLKLEYQAHESGKWAKKYNKLYDRKARSTEKKIAADPSEQLQKTQRAKYTTEALKVDKDYANAINDINVNTLEKHVNRMVSKYGQEKVRSLNYKVEDGKKYVKTALTRLANANATYTLTPYRTVDDRGNVITRYRPTKTRHYAIVY